MCAHLIQSDQIKLKTLAQKYIWWKSPEETLSNRAYFIAHVMNLATWEDAMDVFNIFGEQTFKDTLRSMPPGLIDERSWLFWHRWLRLKIQPMPIRKVA